MTTKRLVFTIAQLMVVLTLTEKAGGQSQQTRNFAPARPAQVTYLDGPQRNQMVIIQVQQTTTVTYIVSPISSAFSQYVINNPRGLVQASQRANQRMRDLVLQALRFKRMGLDNKRSDSTNGMHTIFIGTKPVAIALMDDKTLVDFLLEEIFKAMGLTQAQKEQTLREVIVYNKQGIPLPTRPTFTTVAPAPTPGSPTRKQLTCQDSLRNNCDPSAFFRSADGTCNNLQHNQWGSAFIPLRRFLPPAYDDGISHPRTLSRTGGALPSTRLISTRLHPSGPEGEARTLTHMVMQWGQFLDHDITSTPLQTASDGSALTCCDDEMPARSRRFVDVNNRTACFPIPMPPDDPFFIGRTCFSFPRSVQVTNAKCQQTPVEQLNQITSYVDGSQIYGSSAEDQRILRSFRQGQLQTSGDDLLPRDTDETCVLHNPEKDYCFKAGDIRVNEQMALSSLHTVWLRHHNRLAKQLSEINPTWDDERLFQETRKIVGAQLQKITFGDWLPIILDRRRMARNRLNLMRSGQEDIYKPKVDPSIRNAFASAAFRFGHSLIRTTLSQKTHNYEDAGRWRLEQSFGNTSQILESQGLGIVMYMRGLLRDPPNRVDRFFTGEVQNHLFQDMTGNSLDLVAFNIQRGRDHGLPNYNSYRRFCGLTPVSSFFNMPDHDRDTARRFSQIYESPNDIDLFSGGISELPEGNGLVGPTFACLISKQFRKIKFGDRFWFETSDPFTGFTPSQVEQIRRHSLSRILCDVTAITKIQPNPFKQVSLGNPLMNCQDLSEMNLKLWEEGSRDVSANAAWGAWSAWSQCNQGLQTRVRSCSQGGSRGVCSGSGQDSRSCNDLGWMSEWSQWSSWLGCQQGFQSRTRVCRGLDPCPGSPEESRLCRGSEVSSQIIEGPGEDLLNTGSPGWSTWTPWSTNCDRGKQWRTRTCNPGRNNKRRARPLGRCSGPSFQSRRCRRRGSLSSYSSSDYSVCDYFYMPAFC